MANFPPPAFLLKIATGRNVLLFLTLFIAFSGFIMPALEADIKALSGGVGVIDLQFFYHPAKVLAMLNAYGKEGIHLYLIAQWTVDLVFPAIAGAFFSSCLIWLGAKRWWWLGFMAMFADWVENIFVTYLLWGYPDFSPAIAMSSCFFTSLKWAVIFFCNGLILYYGARKLSVYLKSRLVFESK